MGKIKAYWQQEDNFGDKLTPFLLKELFGIECEFSDGKNKLLAVGSVLHHAKEGDVIWGSGLISPTHLPQSNKIKALAVRGIATRNTLRDFGVDVHSTIFGDPALLLPRVYSPKIEIEYGIGIVPHYVDYEECKRRNPELGQKEVRIVDVRLPIKEVIDQILSCKVIFSSSLHGCIVADAYGIENWWYKLSDKLIGGDFKFLDYKMARPYIDLDKLEEVFKLYCKENGYI